jgi:hypothetical protein
LKIVKKIIFLIKITPSKIDSAFENIYLNVSYDFPKFDGSKKIKV